MTTLYKRMLAAGLVLLAVAALSPGASPREAGAAESSFSSAELKRMSVFLSNFSEQGLTNFTAAQILEATPPRDAIRFGIWHNYINNYKSRIATCSKGCEGSCMVIDGRYVTETLKKYFGEGVKLQSVPGYRYDGKQFHFQAADGAGNPFVKVLSAQKLADGTVGMDGILYNPDNDMQQGGAVKAIARPQTVNGKASWIIVQMSSSE